MSRMARRNYTGGRPHGHLLEPHVVKGLGAAAEHRREIVRQVRQLGLAALLQPQRQNPLGMEGWGSWAGEVIAIATSCDTPKRSTG